MLGQRGPLHRGLRKLRRCLVLMGGSKAVNFRFFYQAISSTDWENWGMDPESCSTLQPILMVARKARQEQRDWDRWKTLAHQSTSPVLANNYSAWKKPASALMGWNQTAVLAEGHHCPI